MVSIELSCTLMLHGTCIMFAIMFFRTATGKLGHGDTNRQLKPKVIEALTGLYIRKVSCGSQSSLAVTSSGQVRVTVQGQVRHRDFKRGDREWEGV